MSTPDLEVQKWRDTYYSVQLARRGAKVKALDALGRYKFEMFGYHASAWVKYNQLLPRVHREPNPFRNLVKLARELQEKST